VVRSPGLAQVKSRDVVWEFGARLVGEAVGGSGSDELSELLLIVVGGDGCLGPWLEERGHRLLAGVGASDEPFVSLKAGLDVKA
jgi:hypothetical protein